MRWENQANHIRADRPESLDFILKSVKNFKQSLMTFDKIKSNFETLKQWTNQENHREGWVPKNWCFWFVALEKTLESPLDSKEIKPVNPKRNQPWIFIGRTDAEAEAPILWLPDAKSQLIWKDPDAGKDWGQEEKRMTEDERVGWHHPFNGDEFE